MNYSLEVCARVLMRAELALSTDGMARAEERNERLRTARRRREVLELFDEAQRLVCPNRVSRGWFAGERAELGGLPRFPSSARNRPRT